MSSISLTAAHSHSKESLDMGTNKLPKDTGLASLDICISTKDFGGPYWDHVLGYWKASLERPDAVLFLKYEGLKKDILLHIRKMAEFMGKPFSAEEEEHGVPQKIADVCSFDNLSSVDVNKNGKHRLSASVEIPNSAYFRKGTVEDWKNHLTQEMIQTVDQITQQKLLGSNLSWTSVTQAACKDAHLVLVFISICF
nr:flavonol 3-sulfotransferase-like [Coffea arabica]